MPIPLGVGYRPWNRTTMSGIKIPCPTIERVCIKIPPMLRFYERLRGFNSAGGVSLALTQSERMDWASGSTTALFLYCKKFLMTCLRALHPPPFSLHGGRRDGGSAFPFALPRARMCSPSPYSLLFFLALSSMLAGWVRPM